MSWGLGLLRAARPNLLPGVEEQDLAFLRLVATLSALALSVYDIQEGAEEGMGGCTYFHLPLALGGRAPAATAAAAAAQPAAHPAVHPAAPEQLSLSGMAAPAPAARPGASSCTAHIAARLAHLQPPSASCPQLFALYEVEGLGLVVAFRGTAALDDALLNANILPQPLPTDPEQQRRLPRPGGGIQLHGGFLRGALAALPAVAAAVRRCRSRPGGPAGQRLWVTGHSLGGALAGAAALHVLADASLHDLLSEGGGVITFGAPMIAYSTDAATLYGSLAALEDWAAERSGHYLCFHNIVHGMDMVPRLLGRALGRAHDLLQALIPRLAAVRAVSECYYPLGQYHLLMGGTLCTLPQQAAPPPQATPPPGGQGGGSQAADSAGGSPCRGRAGSEPYAQAVAAQLELSGVWKAALLAAGEAGLLRDHGMALYKSHLCSHLEAVASAGSVAVPVAAERPEHTTAAVVAARVPVAAAPAWQAGIARIGSAAGAEMTWGPNRSSPSLQQKAALFGQVENDEGGNPGAAVTSRGEGASSAGLDAAVAPITRAADRALDFLNTWLAQRLQG